MMIMIVMKVELTSLMITDHKQRYRDDAHVMMVPNMLPMVMMMMMTRLPM